MTYLLSMLWGGAGATRIPTALLYIVFTLSLGASFINIDQSWGVYHYFIGSKYFKELGYFDLYDCTPAPPGTSRRQLDDYSFASLPSPCDAQFNPGRYISFIQDVRAVGFEPRFLVDKGFNAPPTWVALSELFIGAGIITTANYALIDMLLMLVTFIVLIFLLGLRQALYIAIIVLTFYGTLDRLWGHYAQWVWLALGLMGSAMIHKGRGYRLGGIMLGASVSLAIFPIILIIPHLRKRGVMLGVLIGLGLGVLIGLGNSRGLDAYRDFAIDMTIHSSYVKNELCCNIGLVHSLTHEYNPASPYLAECFASPSPACKEEYKTIPPPSWLALGLAIPISLSPLGIMFGFLTLSRYYFLIMSIVPIWYGEAWGRGLLFLNTLMIAWMILDMDGARIHGGGLWFIFFLGLSWRNKHVKQIINGALAYTQQKIYPPSSPRDVSKPI